MAICRECGEKLPKGRRSTVCHSCEIERNANRGEFDWSGEGVISLEDVKGAHSREVAEWNRRDGYKTIIRYQRAVKLRRILNNNIIVTGHCCLIGFCEDCGESFIKTDAQRFCSDCSIRRYEIEQGRIYILWSNSVKSRDGYCQVCGSYHNLEAHHKIPKKQDPSLARDVDNGITLCKDCHREGNIAVHKILGSRYTIEEFDAWLIVAKKHLLTLDQWL